MRAGEGEMDQKGLKVPPPSLKTTKSVRSAGRRGRWRGLGLTKGSTNTAELRRHSGPVVDSSASKIINTPRDAVCANHQAGARRHSRAGATPELVKQTGGRCKACSESGKLRVSAALAARCGNQQVRKQTGVQLKRLGCPWRQTKALAIYSGQKKHFRFRYKQREQEGVRLEPGGDWRSWWIQPVVS